MSEFVNRVEAQRALLVVVNTKRWPKEELYSLSEKAIDRWLLANGIDPESQLARLVYRASEKLFFLANKSQEQVTEEYKTLSLQFDQVLEAIRGELAAPVPN
jgi:hypothetical protein